MRCVLLSHRAAFLGIVVVLVAVVTSIMASDERLANTVFFEGKPSDTGDLSPWDNIQMGGYSFHVSTKPKGVEKPGMVRVVSDPLGIEGSVYELTVNGEATFAAKSATADRVDLWNNVHPFMGGEGQETWEHFRLMFPANRYHPVPGDWNWLVQHHNDHGYKRFVDGGQIRWEYPELVWGVNTAARLPNGNKATSLFMRVWGGDDTKPGMPTLVFPGETLRYDHWYDILVHVVWSTDSRTGFVAWWLDEKLLHEAHHATLWTRPNGTKDRVNFEFSNYRKHDTSSSTVYFSRVKLGSSRHAVGF